jgi:hypothetical protein
VGRIIRKEELPHTWGPTVSTPANPSPSTNGDGQARTQRRLTPAAAEHPPNLAVPLIAGGVGTAVAAVLVWLVMNAQPGEPVATGPEAFAALEPTGELTCTELVTEYTKNGKALDARYYDRVIAVTGTVEAVHTFRKPAVLVLRGPPNARIALECNLRRGVPLDGLHPGAAVTVRGVFRGRGGPGVVMSGCLVQPAEEP